MYYNKTLAGEGGPDSGRVRSPVIPPEPGLALHPTMKAYQAARGPAGQAGGNLPGDGTATVLFAA